MMSTEIELLILLSLYFHEVLEQLKTYFQTNIYLQSVLHFVVHYSWIYKPLHGIYMAAESFHVGEKSDLFWGILLNEQSLY